MAGRCGIRIDLDRLRQRLGIPVIETVAVRHRGTEALVRQLDAAMPQVPAAPPADADLHAQVSRLLAECISVPSRTARIDDALDRWLLHPSLGLAILTVLMFFMFQAVFSWAEPLMDGIDGAVSWLGAALSSLLPDGALKSLLVDGIVAGVGSSSPTLPGWPAPLRSRACAAAAGPGSARSPVFPASPG